jgi:serine/threonine-protein kinase
MPVATADELVAALRQSNLVPADRLEVWLTAHPTVTSESPKALAGRLVAAGLLTQFQANLLLGGRLGDAFIAGKFKVLDLLGKGGMGAVYLCEHLKLRTFVAVKVLPASPDEDPETRERFYREARAFAKLIHPNLVRGFDVDTDGKIHYIVMEYVDGVDLQLLVALRGPLPVGRAVNYARQAALGLAHAHEQGWVHRDIKPANLAVDRTGLVRVLDMGLARTILEGTDAITRNFDDGSIRGTADYLAPEQASGARVDGRCDIYSLGVTLYYLLTGHLPYEEANTAQKLVAHLIKNPVPMRTFRPELPEELVQVVEVMMAKQAEFRYQSGTDVAEALAPWDGGLFPPAEDEIPRRLPSTAPGATQTRGPTATTSRPRARVKPLRQWLILATLVVVGLFVGGMVVMALRTAPPLRNGPGPDAAPTVSPFMGHYVPVTRKHGPSGEPFPGGHTEYLQGRVYETVAEALKDPRLRTEDNCRILLLDEVHEEQVVIDASALPQGIAIESARTDAPTVWLPPARIDATRPLLQVSGGARLAVRNLTFNGQDKLDTLVAWNEPGPGCQLHDVRVTGFNRTGVALRNPAGETRDPVQLSQVRIYPSPHTTVETCATVAATGKSPARHLRVTECRLEGPAAQGLWSTGGIESFEMIRCRLFGLGTGVRITGPGALQVTLQFNTTAKLKSPVWIENVRTDFGKDDRVLLWSNLILDTPSSAVRFTDVAPAPELFRGSEANWCSAGGCQPETPGLPISQVPDPVIISLDPARDADFLRYPATSPLATIGPGRQPVGVPPR